MSSDSIHRIGVIGAGAWGTALAQTFAQKGLEVTLWARDEKQAQAINHDHRNDAHLSDIELNENIIATSELIDAVEQDAIVVVVPTQYVGKILESVVDHIPDGMPILLASKGIEIETGRLLSHVVSGLLPDHPVGILTGPSFANEVAQNLPAALTLAMQPAHQQIAYELCEALSTPHFRLYASDDIIGAQVGGALKNVIAIACGIAHGKNMGDNARAAIVTRGLAEMVRLGVALGADPQTFLGLSGVGDLTLTCNAMQSRNFSLGVAIGQGARASDILAERNSVAEGFYTAEAVHKLGLNLGIEMPISQAVYETLHKQKAIDYVIKGLLGRPTKAE